MIAGGPSDDDFGTIARMDEDCPDDGHAPSADAHAAGLMLPAEVLQRLFDPLEDLVFFAKDAQGRYTHANRTLVQRLRLSGWPQLAGRRADEVFPAPLGQRFLAQDLAVLRGGPDIVDQLELHLYPDRAPGWCLTQKRAWRDRPGGPVRGLVGISRDLAPSHGAAAQAAARGQAYARVARVVERMQRDFAEPLEVRALAAEAGLSVAQLERLFVQLYRLTPRQWLARQRLEAALAALEGDASVAEVAHACGYADHSAFTRQFRRLTGLSPREWRALRAGRPR